LEISGQIQAPTASFEEKESSTSTGKETVLTHGPLCTLGKEKPLFSLQEFHPNSFTVDRVLLWIGTADRAESSVAMRQRCHPLYNKLYCDKRICLFSDMPY
jgi:hypothetical protein